jgi:hypothetical protein
MTLIIIYLKNMLLITSSNNQFGLETNKIRQGNSVPIIFIVRGEGSGEGRVREGEGEYGQRSWTIVIILKFLWFIQVQRCWTIRGIETLII